MMLSGIYDGHAAGDTLAADRSQSDVPDPTVRLATSIRHWIQFSDWYTTLPHVILYTSFEDLVLRLNHTTLDELRHVSQRMAQHNARVADQLRDEWRDILLKVAKNSPNYSRPPSSGPEAKLGKSAPVESNEFAPLSKNLTTLGPIWKTLSKYQLKNTSQTR